MHRPVKKKLMGGGWFVWVIFLEGRDAGLLFHVAHFRERFTQTTS